MKRFLFFIILGLVGCSGGAVVFAPTPAPPDISPVRYEHPSGAFSLTLPPNWAVYSRNTTTLATAAFSAPASGEPSVTVAVINVGETTDSGAFSDLLDRYQTQVRPDAARYTEQNRQAMGDGSWRITGLRSTAGGNGVTQQVNTFIQQTGDLLGIVDVVVPDDVARMAELQVIANSFDLHEETALEQAELSVMVSAAATDLDIVHLSMWPTAAGVFFITGEVVNNGTSSVTSVPVRAILSTAEGLPVAEAVDVVMGYGISPGEYAPFSLRFGQGQPALTTQFEMVLGSADWQPHFNDSTTLYNNLTWTDDFSFDTNGRLIVSGEVTNTGDVSVNRPRAVVTVFNAAEQVIAAGFGEVSTLAPGESAPYQIVVPEMGGEPAEYIVSVQGLRTGD